MVFNGLMVSVRTLKSNPKVGYMAKAFGLNAIFLLLFCFSASAQGSIDGSMKTLYQSQIKPVLNFIVVVAVAIAAVYCGVMFFQGKREALKQLGMVVAGALVIKFLEALVVNITGINQ